MSLARHPRGEEAMTDFSGPEGREPTDGDDFSARAGHRPLAIGGPRRITFDPGEAQRLRDLAARMIRERAFGDNRLETAREALIQALLFDPDDLAGKTTHLLGLTYFHMHS